MRPRIFANRIHDETLRRLVRVPHGRETRGKLYRVLIEVTIRRNPVDKKSYSSKKKSLILTFVETVFGKTAASLTFSIRAPQGQERNQTKSKKENPFGNHASLERTPKPRRVLSAAFSKNRRTPRIFPIIGDMPANPSRRPERVACPDSRGRRHKNVIKPYRNIAFP